MLERNQGQSECAWHTTAREQCGNVAVRALLFWVWLSNVSTERCSVVTLDVHATFQLLCPLVWLLVVCFPTHKCPTTLLVPPLG